MMNILQKKSYWEKAIFSSHWLYTIYLALVSFVAIVVMCINLGILITSAGKFFLITDEEYILSDRAYEIRACAEPRWNGNVSEEKTPEEVILCEERATETAIAQRSVDLKETLISSFAWVFVFVILFWFHYPRFLATREKK